MEDREVHHMGYAQEAYLEDTVGHDRQAQVEDKSVLHRAVR